MLRPLISLLACLLVATSCSDEKHVLPPDSISPSYVTDLKVVALTNSTAILAWTAPGDDGNKGKPSVYDLRFSTHVFEAADWALLTSAGPLSPPKTPGSPETTEVAGLLPNTTYVFGLKSADERENWSGLSNLASGRTFREAPPEFRLAWGHLGNGPSEFDTPIDIAVEGGRVYVADSNNQRIEIFDAVGNFVTEWQGNSPDPGFFSKYIHLAAAPDGTIFVSDAGNWKLEVFASDGSYLRSWPVSDPGPLASDAQGNIGIARFAYLWILRYRPTGDPLSPVPVPTYWCSSLYCYYPQPINLTFNPTGRMFVLCEHEISGPEIRTFQDTVLVDVWGNEGVRFGSLEDPQDIDADDEGNLFVVDTGNN